MYQTPMRIVSPRVVQVHSPESLICTRFSALHSSDPRLGKAKRRWLDVHMGGKYLDATDRNMLERITKAKRADQCSNATVNRSLALVRAILRKCAREWEWLDRVPSARMLKEPTRRVRYLTHQEAGGCSSGCRRTFATWLPLASSQACVRRTSLDCVGLRSIWRAGSPGSIPTKRRRAGPSRCPHSTAKPFDPAEADRQAL